MTNPIWAAERLKASDARTTTDMENAQITSTTNHVIVACATVLTKREAEDMNEEIRLRVIPLGRRKDDRDYVAGTS
jgi:hypothetical protein